MNEIITYSAIAYVVILFIIFTRLSVKLFFFPDYACPACGGDGIETCNNPDHGFINFVGGELARLGCPCCGHDPEYKMKVWNYDLRKYVPSTCWECNGKGIVNKKRAGKILDDWRIDEPIEDYLISE